MQSWCTTTAKHSIRLWASSIKCTTALWLPGRMSGRTCTCPMTTMTPHCPGWPMTRSTRWRGCSTWSRCSFNRQHNISKWYVLIFIIYHTNFDFSLIRYFDSDVRSGRVLNVSNIRTEHGRIQHWRWSQLLLLWRPGFHSRRRTTPRTSLMFDDVISIKKAMINVNGVNSSRY